jgi:hypothetical protein
MGQRSLIGVVLLGLAACPKGADSVEPANPAPTDIKSRVVADFEAATKASKDAYVALFDFAAVGEMEILLHRYDLNGRLPNLPEDQKAQFAAEDGTPYPAERERRNVGNFYSFLAQRTVGTGGCTAAAPRTRYGQLLGVPYEPLPEGTPAGYETLRTHANEWLTKGGVVGMTCTGGKGGLALVYTAKDNARGYDLITIYDD